MRSRSLATLIFAAGCATEARPAPASYPTEEVFVGAVDVPKPEAAPPTDVVDPPLAPPKPDEFETPDAPIPEPIDLSDEGVVGGIVTGVIGATPMTASGTPASPASAADLARPARLLGSPSWSCPFPPEADQDQVDRGAVVLIVGVALDGSARTVRIVSDPGHGFGRAARICAFEKKYEPARDGTGAKILGETPPIRVVFQR